MSFSQIAFHFSPGRKKFQRQHIAGTHRTTPQRNVGIHIQLYTLSNTSVEEICDSHNSNMLCDVVTMQTEPLTHLQSRCITITLFMLSRNKIFQLGVGEKRLLKKRIDDADEFFQCDCAH